MDRKLVIVNSKAFGYYFLQHFYRKYSKTEFNEEDLIKFTGYFCRFANYLNKCLVREDGSIIEDATARNELCNEILNECTFDFDYNNRLCAKCFLSDKLPEMREAYLNADTEFKNLIIEYETAYVRDSYNSRSVLVDIENICAKNSDKNMEIMDKQLREKGFDA